jgi:predicted aspartyl protease
MLCYQNGDSFSTGVISCEIAPLNWKQDNNRIFLPVEVGGVETRAVVDTGGIYCVVHPAVADNINFDPSESIGNKEITIRGYSYKGSLYRSFMQIKAEQGESLEQEVTVFVPNVNADDWGELPTFLGLTGCLELLRFAVDPSTCRFYFASA